MFPDANSKRKFTPATSLRCSRRCSNIMSNQTTKTKKKIIYYNVKLIDYWLDCHCIQKKIKGNVMLCFNCHCRIYDWTPIRRLVSYRHSYLTLFYKKIMCYNLCVKIGIFGTLYFVNCNSFWDHVLQLIVTLAVFFFLNIHQISWLNFKNIHNIIEIKLYASLRHKKIFF